jgi:hypothetical protein
MDAVQAAARQALVEEDESLGVVAQQVSASLLPSSHRSGHLHTLLLLC